MPASGPHTTGSPDAREGANTDAGEEWITEAVNEADYFVRNQTSAEIELSLPNSAEGTRALLATRVAPGEEALIYHAVEGTGGHTMPSNFFAGFRVAQEGTVLYEGVIDSDWQARSENQLVLTVSCAFEVQAALRRVGVADSARVDCGSFNANGGWGVRGGFDCFMEQAIQKRAAAQLGLNRCVDCLNMTTYVSTPEGKLYAVNREDDAYGDRERVVSVDTCAELFISENERDVTCTDATRLYACREPRK